MCLWRQYILTLPTKSIIYLLSFHVSNLEISTYPRFHYEQWVEEEIKMCFYGLSSQLTESLMDNDDFLKQLDPSLK